MSNFNVKFSFRNLCVTLRVLRGEYLKFKHEGIKGLHKGH